MKKTVIKNKADFPLKNDSLRKVSLMGNILEVQYMSNRNSVQPIQKLDKDTFVDTRTGEIKEVKHIENRGECVKSIVKSFKRIRDVINANVDVQHLDRILWLTLTYRWVDGMPMLDNEVASHDFDVFMKRFKRWCVKNGYEIPKYFCAIEPQASGSWHYHVLFVWNTHAAPFIPNNSVLETLWDKGFTKIVSVDGVDNIGAYLSAYLTDLDVEEDEEYFDPSTVTSLPETVQGKLNKKKFIKGERLKLYPPNLKIFRHSQNINEPKVSFLSQDRIDDIIKDSDLTESYRNDIKIFDESTGFESYISTSQYKLNGQLSQESLDMLERSLV